MLATCDLRNDSIAPRDAQFGSPKCSNAGLRNIEARSPTAPATTLMTSGPGTRPEAEPRSRAGPRGPAEKNPTDSFLRSTRSGAAGTSTSSPPTLGGIGASSKP